MLIFLLSFYLTMAAEGHAKMEKYIVGGFQGSIYSHPHSAFLYLSCITDEGRANFICGASILNQKILLTAAHCMYPCEYQTRITVNMGSPHRDKGLVREVNGYLIHAKYNPSTMDCDIGMANMALAVRFGVNLARVAIMYSPPYGEPATVAGWGQINEVTQAHGTNLKFLDQKLLQFSLCYRLLGTLPRGTLCARSERYSGVAAKGDSGSALVVRGYIQIGIVSFKRPDKVQDIVVYTDVGYYYQWIVSHAIWLYCQKN